MTDAEDAHNAELNELIRACDHPVITRWQGQLRCGKCPARFGVVLFPRRAKPFFLDDSESTGLLGDGLEKP